MRLRVSKRVLAFGLGVGLPVALAGALVAPGVGLAASATTHATSQSTSFTFYGFTDNSPPGTAIAHPGCTNGGHSAAGGLGTFANPITYATPGPNGPWCQVIYVPFLKKYFIHEDQCGTAATTCGGVSGPHDDLWMGGDANSVRAPESTALLACENKWTQVNTAILNPASNLPVVTTPLFEPPTTCVGGSVSGGTPGPSGTGSGAPTGGGTAPAGSGAPTGGGTAPGGTATGGGSGAPTGGGGATGSGS